jgi:hypothetical protein
MSMVRETLEGQGFTKGYPGMLREKPIDDS